MKARDVSEGVLWAGLICWTAAGCAPRAAEPQRLIAQQRPPFSDIPIPVGFRIVEDESEDAITGKRRLYVRHVYEGRGDPYTIRDFYREQMPQHRWQMAHAAFVSGVHSMLFQKGAESCTISISKGGGAWRDAVKVAIMILQEEPGSPAPNTKN